MYEFTQDTIMLITYWCSSERSKLIPTTLWVSERWGLVENVREYMQDQTMHKNIGGSSGMGRLTQSTLMCTATLMTRWVCKLTQYTMICIRTLDDMSVMLAPIPFSRHLIYIKLQHPLVCLCVCHPTLTASA